VLLQPATLTVEEPAIYVNAKQFKGILRRRLARAKWARERRVSVKRKVTVNGR
jgi:nuclear transcription factor Y, alpha